MRLRRLAARGWKVLAPVALSGCYAYSYPPTAPTPGAHVAVDLTDMGRVQMRDHIGPSVLRIDGLLTDVTDSALTLRVEQTVGIAGNTMPWTGEEVTIPRAYVGMERVRKFSPGRTVMLAGAMAAGVVSVLAGRGLGGASGGTGEPPPGQGQ